MLNIFNYYPPAETKIPWSAILSALKNDPVNFSNVLCKYLDTKHCILAESARSLLFNLLLALKKNNASRRDEVLIPGYTCYSVAAAVAKSNLNIKLYDLDPVTLHPDVISVKEAISERTLAVVAQHLFGFLSPLDELKQLSRQYGAYLIEDSAQALAKMDDLKTPGTIGDFGLFSFGRGKPLPVGGGGALVHRDHTEIVKEISLLGNNKGYKHATISAVTQIVSNPFLYWIPESLPLRLGKTVFDLNFSVKNIPKTIEQLLTFSMPSLDRLNQHRTQIADIYSGLINSKFQVKNTGNGSSIIRYPVLIPDRSLSKELKRLGVRRMYPQAISEVQAIKPFIKHPQKPTPGSVEIAEQLHTLPTQKHINEAIAVGISKMVMKYAG